MLFKTEQNMKTRQADVQLNAWLQIIGQIISSQCYKLHSSASVHEIQVNRMTKQ